MTNSKECKKGNFTFSPNRQQMKLNCKVKKNGNPPPPPPYLCQPPLPTFQDYPPFLAKSLVPPSPQVTQFWEGPTPSYH